MFQLSQGWVIYLFVFLIVPLLLSIRSYIWGPGGYAFLNKKNMQVMKGVSILSLVMQSTCVHLDLLGSLAIVISKTGILGASLYLFCCGYEEMSLYRRHKRYLKGFLPYHVLRPLVIFLSVNVLGWFMMNIRGEGIGFLVLLDQLGHFRLFNQSSAWFIGALIYFYIAFYVSYRTKFKMNLLFILSLFYLGVSRYLGLNPVVAGCFFMGAFCSRYKSYLFRALQFRFSSLFLGTTFLFFLSFGWYLKGGVVISWVLPYCFIACVLCLLMKLQCQSYLFTFIGSCGVEIYVLHQLLLEGILANDVEHVLIRFLFFVTVLFLFASLIRTFFFPSIRKIYVKSR